MILSPSSGKGAKQSTVTISAELLSKEKIRIQDGTVLKNPENVHLRLSVLSTKVSIEQWVWQEWLLGFQRNALWPSHVRYFYASDPKS